MELDGAYITFGHIELLYDFIIVCKHHSYSVCIRAINADGPKSVEFDVTSFLIQKIVHSK